jgi:hypothetical protein
MGLRLATNKTPDHLSRIIPLWVIEWLGWYLGLTSTTIPPEVRNAHLGKVVHPSEGKVPIVRNRYPLRPIHVVVFRTWFGSRRDDLRQCRKPRRIAPEHGGKRHGRGSTGLCLLRRNSDLWKGMEPRYLLLPR